MFNSLSGFNGVNGFRGVLGFLGGRGFSPSGTTPPAGSIFFWPFGATDSLDEVLKGADATLERDSVATVVKGGTLVEVGVNEARFDDNGLFLESEATNYLINSKFINDGSTVTGYTNSGTGITSFNDLSLYSEVNFSVTSDREFLQRSVNVSAAGVKVFSVFVKDLTSIQIQETLRLFGFTDISINEWRFNGETKAATDAISGDGLIELEATIDADVAGNMRVGLGVFSGGVTASGTFYTPQIEDNISTGSILTGTGGTETREADYATAPVSTSQAETPTNNFFRQLNSVKINSFTASGAALIRRMGTTSDEFLGYAESGADLKMLYIVNSVSAVGTTVTIPNFDKSIPITSIKTEANSTNGTTITVVYNGATYTDTEPSDTMGAMQGTKDDFQGDGGEGFSQSIGSVTVGSL